MSEDIKHLWVDTETMSFNEHQADIIQIAGFFTVNGKIEDKFNLWLEPAIKENYEKGIWKFHEDNLGLTKKDILNLPNEELIFKQFRKQLGSYIKDNRFNKLIISGYNVRFDRGKLNAWFDLHNSNLNKYIQGRCVDVYYILSFLFSEIPFNTFNLSAVWEDMVKSNVVKKLKTDVCHSAMTDIKKTYILYKKICEPILKDFRGE